MRRGSAAMMSATATKHQPSAAKKCDPWDEDELGENDDWGPSWTKAYVGGLKVRQYAVSAASVSISAAPAQPTSGGRKHAARSMF
jgi:hypothetical protein